MEKTPTNKAVIEKKQSKELERILIRMSLTRILGKVQLLKSWNNCIKNNTNPPNNPRYHPMLSPNHNQTQ